MNDSQRLKSFNRQEQKLPLKSAFIVFQEQSYVFSDFSPRVWLSIKKKKKDLKKRFLKKKKVFYSWRHFMISTLITYLFIVNMILALDHLMFRVKVHGELIAQQIHVCRF